MLTAISEWPYQDVDRQIGYWFYRTHLVSVDSRAVSVHVKFWQLSASPFYHSDIPVYLFTHNLSCFRHRLHSVEEFFVWKILCNNLNYEFIR